MTSLRKIIASGDPQSLVEYADQVLGFLISSAEAISIIERSVNFGGTAGDAWSESTWNVWLKQQITAPQPDDSSRRLINNETVATGCGLKRVLQLPLPRRIAWMLFLQKRGIRDYSDHFKKRFMPANVVSLLERFIDGLPIGDEEFRTASQLLCELADEAMAEGYDFHTVGTIGCIVDEVLRQNGNSAIEGIEYIGRMYVDYSLYVQGTTAIGAPEDYREALKQQFIVFAEAALDYFEKGEPAQETRPHLPANTLLLPANLKLYPRFIPEPERRHLKV